MQFTQLLIAADGGDPTATTALFSQVYNELRRIASSRLAQEHPGHTLQPTALVHEVYLKLLGDTTRRADGTEIAWQGRGHFFAAASEAMRRILIDSARRKRRKKHGGGLNREPLDAQQVALPEADDDLLALDEALQAFGAVEPKIAELVTLRYFGGLSQKDAAEALGIAPRTADSYWAYARAWLLAEIKKGDVREK